MPSKYSKKNKIKAIVYNLKLSSISNFKISIDIMKFFSILIINNKHARNISIL